MRRRLKHRKLKIRILVICLSAVLLLLLGIFINCLVTLKRPDETALKILTDGGIGTIKVSKTDDGLFIDGPGTESAIIFYPGEKVDCAAYLPLLCNLAEKGYDSYSLKMPFGLSFFTPDKAGKIIEKGKYKRWILMGHSSGGVTVSAFASGNKNRISGLVLLGSSGSGSLSGSDIPVLVIYGSEDKILNRKGIVSYREKAGSNYHEFEINGANHANFGNYGKQRFDGTANIPADEQQSFTVEKICELFGD